MHCLRTRGPGLFGTTRIRWYMSQPHHFPSKYGKLLGELSRTTKVPLSTAFHLKSNPALCWTAPHPSTHKYGRKSSHKGRLKPVKYQKKIQRNLLLRSGT
ncbi:hypothetical protein CMV_006099 [Castanea mollissima]|uniref:Uncharacterized protein n=1 Tax=Castanea mollissima TaxID=60419 RepID=A0A8J4RHS3_9ROSI|nr:hypothetical protein CMV_006099 [Castanea mollissima]